MSFIGSMFDNSKGAGFQGASTNVVQPSTSEQANTDYQTSQQALQSQQALLNQLSAQNGIGNQSQVYNQLQGVANGTGPNPAQTALNQNTANNISQQASLMGSQRGASANPALIARQIAMQGANTQQQAVGQAANMQANQSLNALGQLGNLANQQASNQLNATNAYNQSAQGNRGLTLNGIQGQNNANVGLQSNINNVNAGIAAGNQKFQQQLFGGALQGASSGAGALGGGGGGGAAGGSTMAGEGGSAAMLAAHGGVIPKMAQGGNVDGPSSAFGRSMQSMPQQNQLPAPMMMAQGGKVPVIVSPGEAYVRPENVKQVASGKASVSEAAERIPGKAKVKGDSLKNDTVPKELDAGGVVIPRTVMNSKDPAKNAAKFVAAVVAKQGMKSKKRG